MHGRHTNCNAIWSKSRGPTIHQMHKNDSELSPIPPTTRPMQGVPYRRIRLGDASVIYSRHTSNLGSRRKQLYDGEGPRQLTLTRLTCQL
ncbi:hypothetical protein Pmani_028839 [Petrolisthes manimaculis]|uniref:Uncharacterized protein n=1 Tax=Petrolisthes manimaculis TaxID=1843537 RepID=A0AAE1TUG8_9EUCA|nr:hypothetical protein Pmani_028839 [Petrolisthes manimaculis]